MRSLPPSGVALDGAEQAQTCEIAPTIVQRRTTDDPGIFNIWKEGAS